LLILTKKGAAVEADWSSVATGMIVEARVTAQNKGGLSVEVNGIRGFMPASQVDIRRIEDLSVFVGEKLVNRPTMGGSTNDFSDNESWAGPGYVDADIMRGAVPTGGVWYTPTADLNIPDATLLSSTDTALNYRFGSAHTGGCLFTFADGSVRFVRFTVDATTFMRACKRDDGQVLDMNSL